MQALELFLSRFHKDELWAECLKCGRRYENEEHRCDKEGGDVTETNKGASGQMENDRTSSGSCAKTASLLQMEVSPSTTWAEPTEKRHSTSTVRREGETER